MTDDNNNGIEPLRRPEIEASDVFADVDEEVEQPQSRYKLPAWVQQEIDAVFRPSPDGERGVGPNDIPHTAQLLKESFRARGVRLGIEDIRRMLKQTWRQFTRVGAGDWQANLRTEGREERPSANISNTTLYLIEDPVIGNCLKFNEFSGEVILRRDLSPLKSMNFKEEPFSDVHITMIQEYLEREGMHRISSKTVGDAAILTARREYGENPVVDYLRNVEWDETPRLDKFFATYFGAEPSPYTAAVGRKALISMVARAIDEGCKVDTVPVLEGPQGARKSSALRILAGDAYFGDNVPNLANKDASSYLRGLWLAEIAEFHTFGKADVDNLKAFISRQEERYRPAYGRMEIVQKRKVVFWGTTNDNEYLNDPTGARRFWPIRCGTIDLDALKRDRDQLWAEAVYWFDKDEHWWPDDDERPMFEEQQAMRRMRDPWEYTIEAEIHRATDKLGVSVPMLLDVIKPDDPAGRTKGDENRIGRCLRALGYVPIRPRDEKGVQHRRWAKPEREPKFDL